MEDLQDAVEDVKLINAMTDEPQPTEEWKLPTSQQVKDYVTQEEENNPDALELPGICSNCLGFYLFRRYLVEKGEQAVADFLMDVAIYKQMKSRRNRVQHARFLHSCYLRADPSRGRPQRSHEIPRGLCRSLQDSKKDECSIGPPTSTPHNWAEFFKFDNESASPIYFNGEPLDEVLDVLKEVPSSVPIAQAAISPAAALLKANLFDRLESIVFSYVQEKHMKKFQKSAHHQQYLSFMTLSTVHVKKEDFTLFRVLGRGGFGVVYGCKKSQSGHLYALKVLDRKRIKARRAADLCITERNLLSMLDSPFIVGLKYAYETPAELHLVLDIMTGGDLGYHLRRKGIFNKLETKYYLCRTVLGLRTLHSYNIVFRDLKPDNILMDGRGRTALSDLGLAVRVPRNGIAGACGTRGYWAPEMLQRAEDGSRVRYSLSVDWFSLGCVLYQFMAGVCPFRKLGDDVRVLMHQKGEDISKDDAIDKAVCEMEPTFAPELFDETSRDLIQQLLNKNGKERLGARGGAAEVMAHPFFKEVNWDEYEDDAVKPPCLPRKDLNYASQNEIGVFALDEEQSDVEILLADLEVFSQWSYTRPAAFLEEVVEYMQYEAEKGPINIQKQESICCSIS